MARATRIKGSLIQKGGGGNPYHDEIGRFTTGGSGSGAAAVMGSAGHGVDIRGPGGKLTHVETSQEGAAWIEKHRVQNKTGELGSRTNPVACGNDIEKAARLIVEGKHVTLNQPEQVSTLVAKIKHDVAKAKAAGHKAPVFNIADISVAGTNLFAQENLDIPRVRMPQLSGHVVPGSKAAALLTEAHGEVDLTQQFLDSLTASGIKTQNKEIISSHLRASQDELDGAKIGAMADHMNAGTMKKGRIFVTRDNYVLDGHHRWGAVVVNDLKDNHPGDLTVPSIQLDIDIGTALSRARAFQEEWGIVSGHMAKKQDFASVLKQTLNFRVHA